MDVVDSGQAPVLPAGLSDDWVFGRDLPCPECRYNLRMLRAPRCPECGTVYRWQALLQVTCPRCDARLENVDADECPRCRLALNWERLLAEADPEQRKLFEYTDRPVRAAPRTWLGALRPRRFWMSIPIESPPAVRRLRWLRRAAFGACLVPLALAFWLFDAWVTTQGALEWLPVLGVVFLLPVLTMIGLPRFTPTLTRFKVRPDQLLRCFAYGSAGLAWIGLLLSLFVAIALVVNQLWPITWAAGAKTYQDPRLIVYPPLALECLTQAWLFSSPLAASIWLNGVLIGAILYFSFVWWWPFLWTALRGYLQLNRRNALALFLSTQLVGLLVILIVLIRYSHLGPLIGSILNRL